jgi:hypothetical protein
MHPRIGMPLGNKTCREEISSIIVYAAEGASFGRVPFPSEPYCPPITIVAGMPPIFQVVGGSSS